MMKKKAAAIVLGIMFCAGLIAGCGQKQTDQAAGCQWSTGSSGCG